MRRLSVTSRNGRSADARNSLEILEPRHLLTGELLITEFQAINDTTLQDANEQFPDWIEVSNESKEAMSLNGWYLTDDEANLAKWQFPDVTIGASEQLVVFASGDERRRHPGARVRHWLWPHGFVFALWNNDPSH